MKLLIFILLFIPNVSFAICDENPDLIKRQLGAGATKEEVQQAIADCITINTRYKLKLQQLKNTMNNPDLAIEVRFQALVTFLNLDN